jgi:hypothetical protein
MEVHNRVHSRIHQGASWSERRNGYLKLLSNDLADHILVSQMLCANTQRKKSQDESSTNQINIHNDVANLGKFSFPRSQTAFNIKTSNNSNKLPSTDKQQHLSVPVNIKVDSNRESKQGFSNLKRINTTFAFRSISRETSSVNISASSFRSGQVLTRQNEIYKLNTSYTMSDKDKSFIEDLRISKANSRGKTVHIDIENNRTFSKERIADLMSKFKKAVKKSLAVIIVIKSFKEKNMINSLQALNISKVVSVEQDAISRELIFNKNIFKRSREINLHENIKKILKMNVEERNENLLRAALSAINQIVPEFEEFPQHIQKAFIKYGFYEEFEPGRMLLKEGHFASYYYLIISGNVMVTLVSNDETTGEIKSRPISFLKRGA